MGDYKMSNTLKIGDVEVGGRAWIAPMTGVSDLPFRKAASKLGATYVATEMVACAEFSKGRPDVVRRAAVGVVSASASPSQKCSQGRSCRTGEAAGIIRTSSTTV